MAIGLLVFVLYPVISLARTSVLVDGELSLQYYRQLLQSSRGLIWNSAFTAALSALFSTILATAIALCITTARGKMKAFLMLILLITMVSPPFLYSLAYIQLFGRRGWITYYLLHLSLNPYNWRGVVMMQTVSFVPINALLLLGMIDKVDGTLIQSARDLGSSPMRAVRDVLLPLIRPGILACLLLTFIRALADFSTPVVIGGRFNTIASEIYLRLIGYADLGQAAALNMLIFIPAGLLFLVYRRLMHRSSLLLSSGGHSGSGRPQLQIEGLPNFIIQVVSGLFFLAMLLTYTCIFASGFLKSIRGRYQFTWEHLERLLTYDLSSLTRSVVYALTVALLGTLFAMVFAYYVERRRIRGRNTLDFLATMPYMIPGTCFGIGYILAFNSEPLKLTGTVAIVMICMLFRQLPNTTKLCSAALAQIPAALEDAARDLGAGRLRVLANIILPNLNRAFFSSFVYNFTTSMTTAGAIIFLIHPAQKVAVFRLLDAIITGEYGIASLISTVVIIITLVVNLALLRFTREKEKGDGFPVIAAQWSE